MEKAYKNILVEIKDGVGCITINRPTQLNALNKETIEELHEAFRRFKHRIVTVRVIMVTGSGDKSFCCRCRHQRISCTLSRRARKGISSKRAELY